MRRLALVLVMAAACVLLSSGIAAAAVFPGSSPPSERASGILTGHVYDYDGSPLADVGVNGSARNDAGVFIWDASTRTGADGAYSFSDAPATSAGRLIVSPNATDSWFIKGLAFVDPGTTTYDVRPGRIEWTATRGGPFASGWTEAGIDVAGNNSGTGNFGASTRQSGLSTDATVAGRAAAMPGTVTYAAFMFFENEGTYWDASVPGNSPIAVTAGATATTKVSFDESSAHRIGLVEPYWASGPPGSTVVLGLENYAAGEQAAMMGYSANESEATFTTWNDKVFTSSGLSEQNVELQIPTAAVPGLDYLLIAGETSVHANTMVFALTERFQVCTLAAAPAAIKPGKTVRLGGVVPVAGNLRRVEGEAARAGDVARAGKVVTIFARTTAASAPPTVWDPVKAGWKKVATLHASSSGAYQSGKLKLKKTTWYVARYDGDEQYRGAYTAVIKVTVK